MKKALREGNAAALNVYSVGYVYESYTRRYYFFDQDISIVLSLALVQASSATRRSLVTTLATRRMMALLCSIPPFPEGPLPPTIRARSVLAKLYTN
jgi:hypothetical protein